MTITAAIVVFAVIWFLTVLIALPIGIRTQAEAGHVEPGTPASAPAEAGLRRKLLWSTLITLVLWGAICAVILWGGISVADLDPRRAR